MSDCSQDGNEEFGSDIEEGAGFPFKDICLLKSVYCTIQDERMEVRLLVLVRFAVELSLIFIGFRDKVTYKKLLFENYIIQNK